MKDVNGDTRHIIITMQDQIEYLMEFIDIHCDILEGKTGGRQSELTIAQKKTRGVRILLMFLPENF